MMNEFKNVCNRATGVVSLFYKLSMLRSCKKQSSSSSCCESHMLASPVCFYKVSIGTSLAIPFSAYCCCLLELKCTLGRYSKPCSEFGDRTAALGMCETARLFHKSTINGQLEIIRSVRPSQRIVYRYRLRCE